MISQGTSSNRIRPFKPMPFGRYTLLQPLATGGMGEIFLAKFEGARGFEKLCVIKRILPQYAEEPQFVERFIHEARVLVKLSHGAIAQVLDLGVHEGVPFLALEFVDGKDLRKVAAKQREKGVPLPLTFLLHVTSRVLDALAYAHRKRDDDEKELGLVHRDVSPQNVLVSYEGEVKVIDFGLAKSTLNSTKTSPSIILGKFLYMSPEQARHAKVDKRSDLYSVGLCLYELISGANPFDLVAPGELINSVANPKIRPLSEVEPLCPPALATLVMKALASEPSHRFQSAEEFRGKLTATLLDIDPSAGPESASRFMRDLFANEYSQERRVLSGYFSPMPVHEVTKPRGEELKPPQVKPVALSFQPTPKVGGASREVEHEATVPGAVVDAGAMAVRPVRGAVPTNIDEPPTAVNVEAWDEPVTAVAPVVVPEAAYRPDARPGGVLPPPTARLDTPWGPVEPTMPAGLAMARSPGAEVTAPAPPPKPAPKTMPSVVVDPLALNDTSPNGKELKEKPPLDIAASIADVLEQDTSPRAPKAPEPEPSTALVKRQPVLQPVSGLSKAPAPLAPLPRALQGQDVHDSQDTSRTQAPRAQWLWLLVPLAAVAVVAALLVWGPMRPPGESGQSPFQPSTGPDTRRREVPAAKPDEGDEVAPLER